MLALARAGWDVFGEGRQGCYDLTRETQGATAFLYCATVFDVIRAAMISRALHLFVNIRLGL